MSFHDCVTGGGKGVFGGEEGMIQGVCVMGRANGTFRRAEKVGTLM